MSDDVVIIGGGDFPKSNVLNYWSGVCEQAFQQLISHSAVPAVT